ncbi:MAG: ABC transporter permease subunit, partial [Hyphomicrobiales bacterium]
AWIVLLGRKGALNNFLIDIGLIDRPLKLIFNFTGVMIGMSHALMPLAVLTMLSVMEGINPNLSKAGATMGARGGQTFWRIYFPLSVPGIAASGMLVFITALGFFITPALLGGAHETMIVQTIIFQIKEVLNWGFAGAIGVLLMVAVLLLFFVYDKLLGLSTLSGGEVTRANSLWQNPIGFLGALAGGLFTRGMGTLCEWIGIAWDSVFPPRPGRRRRGGGRVAIWLTALLVMSFLALPALFVIPVSFTEEGFLGWPPKGFSLQWYQRIADSDIWAWAAIRSFTVAIVASALAMLLGVPAAFMLARQSFTGKGVVFAFLVSPMIIPHIFIAVGLFFLYSRLGLTGTTVGLIIGHTVVVIPYVVVTILAVVKGYDQHLDMAAWTLGANRRQTLARITLPIIRSGMIAAFMFAFVISFDELTIALFVTGGEVTTLPKQMWDDALLRVSPALAAVATLLLLFMSAFILVTEILRRRAEKLR